MAIATFPAGLAYTLPLQVLQADGVSPSQAFLSTDTLTGYLWPGDDQSTPDSPSVVWSNPATTSTLAQYQINFIASDTQGYTPGIYRIVVTATRGSTTSEIL